MIGVFRAALRRSNSTVCSLQRNHGSAVFMQQFPKCFSTEAEQPPRDSTARPFLKTDNSGLTYARLFGIHKHTLKTDVINFLEGCNLTLEDVKLEYNRSFMPLSMMLQFRTRNAFENAIRTTIRKGRLFKIERTDRSQWDIVTPYDGKTILMEGLPRSSTFDDVERILSGLEYDPSSINMFLRAGGGVDPIKMVTVLFPSRTQAMNAFIRKNRSFCLNNRILIRILQ